MPSTPGRSPDSVHRTHGLGRQRPLGHAALSLEADAPVGLDLAHQEAHLVHVREDHHRGQLGVAGQAWS